MIKRQAIYRYVATNKLQLPADGKLKPAMHMWPAAFSHLVEIMMPAKPVVRASLGIHRTLLIGSWQLASVNCQLGIGNWQVAIGNWQLAIGNWQLAIGNCQVASSNWNCQLHMTFSITVVSEGI